MEELFPILLFKHLKGEDLTIYGDGSQTRSFCYVDDLVEAILRTMDQEETVGPVNIGNPVEFTIRELAEQVLAKVGSSSKLIEMPLPSDDPTQLKPDISLAKKFWSGSPKFSCRRVSIGRSLILVRPFPANRTNLPNFLIYEFIFSFSIGYAVPQG